MGMKPRASGIGFSTLSSLYVNTNRIKKPNKIIAGIYNRSELNGKQIPKISIGNIILLLKADLNESEKLSSIPICFLYK